MKKKVGLWLGPILAGIVLLLPVPSSLSLEAQRTAAITVLMTVWWVTEAVELAATALIPLVFFPLVSVLSVEETAKRYSDPNVFLFMGGFMLALAMQRTGLHKRMAFAMIRLIGGGKSRLLAGFMLATAFLSLWVSNTAAALIMLPIGMAVLDGRPEQKTDPFGIALMLGIAYASSIGGVATLVGKPTNLIFVGEAKNLFPELPEIGFAQWSSWAFPLALGFLVLTWAYLAFCFTRGKGANDHGASRFINEQCASLGKMTSGEKRVITVFLLTVAAWMWPGKNIHDGVIAMASSLALFILPDGTKNGGRLLEWEWARRLPWDVILLFGGSFALADGFHKSGLAQWIAGSFGAFRGMPPVLLVLLLCLATSFLSELMSNTAQTAIMMPLLAAASGTLGVHPYLLMIPATVAASLSFMMPVGTPPNAIVVASGRIRIPDMAKAGLPLNILGAFWVTFITFALLKPFLHL